MFFEMRFDLGTLDSGERSLPFGLLVFGNLQIAGIRVQLNQLREDLDEAVKVQDFEKANTIKTQVAELDAEKARLLETTETATEEIRTERVDI